jgi:3-oxoacyl-[acyl-carrier-protein] synthase-3
MTGEAVGRMIGVGRALGSRLVTNDDLAERLDTNDAWIVERTGIKQRYFTADDEDCATLAISAAKQALGHAGVDGDTVDLVLCATSTAPESMPSVACLIGESIGAPGVGAFDLAAACTGFSYGASVAASMLQTGAANRILLVGADAFTEIVDGEDRSTAVLFGDGAGAVVLDRGDGESGFVDHILGAAAKSSSLPPGSFPN